MHHLPKLFSGYHFARYTEKSVLYHCISRTERRALLLRPDRRGKLREICYGVLSKALEQCPTLKLYDFAIISNHFHFVISADTSYEIARFMRYLKAEITLRWHKQHLGRSGPLWERRPYKSTALPTLESYKRCFVYTLAQGCKEGLVEKPTDWPGPHAAQFWFKGKKALAGRWFNGTAYSKANYKAKKMGKSLDKAPFYEDTELRLSPLPGVIMNEAFLTSLERNIIADGKEARAGRPCLGLENIFRSRRDERRELPNIAWLERRGTHVAWCSGKEAQVREYLNRLFEFQREYRIASKQWLQGKLKRAAFPKNCFMPTKFVTA